MAKKILIVSGEPSGDLHASNLVRDLKSLNPNLEFFGLGGDLSKNAGVDVIYDISDLALVGITEVIKNINTVRKAYNAVISKIDEKKPEAAILVDYPGFNLRLAKELKRKGIPVVYYISPQVWAWGRGRINIIKQCVKKIIVFFKFEEELYKTHDVDAEFVGHPLLETAKPALTRPEVLKKYGLSSEKTTIALLPGSRKNEVVVLLKIMTDAAGLIDRTGHAQFIIAKHPSLPTALYDEAIGGCGSVIKIGEADTYNILAASDFAIVASGSATLETAIIGTPLIIIYKAHPLTYLLATYVANIRTVGLVNIIGKKKIAPELLQWRVTPENIASEVLALLNNPERLRVMREDVRNIKSSLGSPGASMRAARAILPLLQ